MCIEVEDFVVVENTGFVMVLYPTSAENLDTIFFQDINESSNWKHLDTYHLVIGYEALSESQYPLI